MYTLDLCRICLLSPVEKDIRDLKICENDNSSKSYVEILLFCLNIEVSESPAISTKLCGKCYETILTYHEFKTIALRNDRYFKTLIQSTMKLDQIVKEEPDSEPNSNDINTELDIDNIEVKDEFVYSDDDDDDDDDLLNSVVKLEEVKKQQTPTTENQKSVEALIKNNNQPKQIKLKFVKNLRLGNNHVCPEEGGESFADIDQHERKHLPLEERRLHPFKESNNQFDSLCGRNKHWKSTDLAFNRVECCDIDDKNGSHHNNEVKANVSETLKKHQMEKDHPDSEFCVADDEPQSLLKLSKEKITDNEPSKKKFKILEGPNTEETGRNLKTTTKSEENVPTFHVNFDKTVLNTQEQRTHNLKSAKKRACNIGNYKTNNEIILKFHMKSHSARRHHTGIKPYACVICGKEFAVKAHFEIHFRIHTGEKPFACHICNKKFAQKGNLDNHIRIHTGEKPYACEVCDKKFAQKANLYHHIKIHRGEKPYACEICDKKFSQKGNLQNHTRIHTGEKPYACEVCDQKFVQKGTLQYHIRKVHTVKKM